MRAFTWALVLCHICSAQAVKVRVISGYDGRPLPKQVVFVQFFYEKPPKISPPLHIETDANGEAQFNISESPPENIDVGLALTSEHWHCACWVMADTEKVLREGIVQITPTNVPNAPIAPASAEPGQIVFIARPFTFFEKLLYPFFKQKLDVALPDFRLLPETTTRGPGLSYQLVHPTECRDDIQDSTLVVRVGGTYDQHVQLKSGRNETVENGHWTYNWAARRINFSKFLVSSETSFSTEASHPAMILVNRSADC